MHTPANDLLVDAPFIHIPGPNPILRMGEPGAWDDKFIEMAGIFEDLGTYYLYYHGFGFDEPGYRVGVATASHPLGPFVKHGDAPILDLQLDTREDQHVACSWVIKEGVDRYLMFYSSKASTEPFVQWNINLATAPHPLGPWTRYTDNPIIEDFGYVGSVVQANGRYFLYSEYPIGSTGDDYGPGAVAVADHPEGPWIQHPDNPILQKGDWGEWDDGGVSESSVVYSGGTFHLFYAGAKLHETRRKTRESIGYAYSHDGLHFTKHGRNPVVSYRTTPNASSFSEPCVLVEMPFVYVYHTLRYQQPWLPDHQRDPLTVEDIGVQVLATQTPCAMTMPLLECDTLAAGQTCTHAHTLPLNVSTVRYLSLTIACQYGGKATKPLKVVLQSSPNGEDFDTQPVAAWFVPVAAGSLSRATFEIEPKWRYFRLHLENQDADESVKSVRIDATLSCR